MEINTPPIFTEGDMRNFNYIVRHKRNLLKAFNMFISVIHLIYKEVPDLDVDFIDLKNRVLQHDLDKFKPEIFYGYSKKYYNENSLMAERLGVRGKNSPFPEVVLASLDLDSKQKIEDDFKKAFEKHYNNNRHHPEYYKSKGGKMKDIDICEMCIDFTAMSIKFGGKPYDYYNDKKRELKREFKDIINYDLMSKILEVISSSFNFREVDEEDEQK